MTARILSWFSTLLVVGAVGLTAVIAYAGQPDKVTVCHAAGTAGTLQYVTLEVPPNEGGFPQGHFTEGGTQAAGHELDYLGACTVPEVPPTVTALPTDPPTPVPTADPTQEPTLEPTPTTDPGCEFDCDPTATSEPVPTDTPPTPVDPPTVEPTPTSVLPNPTPELPSTGDGLDLGLWLCAGSSTYCAHNGVAGLGDWLVLNLWEGETYEGFRVLARFKVLPTDLWVIDGAARTIISCADFNGTEWESRWIWQLEVLP